MVGLERPGIGTARGALQHRRLDLQEAPPIQPTAHRAHRQGPATEGLAGVGRDDQIEVALAVALLHVRQAVPLVGQGLQGLAQHLPAAHLHRQLAPVGAAQGALHADQVAGVHQGGEVGEGLGIVGHRGDEGGLLDKQLDRAGFIRKGEEGELAHHPPGHHPAGHGHHHIPLLAVGQIGMGRLQLGVAVAGLEPQGIGPLPQRRQGLAFLQAGLAQLRQGTGSAQLPAILQEHGAEGTACADGSGSVSRLRWRPYRRRPCAGRHSRCRAR